ncbi:MAG TPA: aminotransferase class V-fold PLP-dependent enzyme [Phycisphaerae bacterium]|nr:aminotransferase class V-fold PLP-dependent enzyme [Phycisphaerae bacterium]HNU43907.1 aminotransferase class V-fold PLP-dependent enzyme [Phycisphaerae bacterium]
MTDWIYLDNNATTEPLPEVIAAVAEALREHYANPSSVHRFGQGVRHRVECAREQVAALLGAQAKEIVFTSGGTESINLALRGLLSMHPERRHVVASAVEHSAVLRVMESLERHGYCVHRVGVDADGRLDEAEFNARLSDQTALISLIHANNETGVIFDVERLSRLAVACGAAVHVDAVQSAGKLPLDVSRWAAHCVSISAHKFHGPKGVGALYVRRRTRLEPLIVGGRQERELRAGTEPVADIIGMGVAADVVRTTMPEMAARVSALRDRLEAGVLRSVPGARVHGVAAPRLCNTSNVGFAGLAAEGILILLSEAGTCASSAAACSSGALEPSHVLKAMHVDPRSAHGAIRFSLSRFNTDAQIDRVVAELPRLVARLGRLNGERPTEEASP